MGRVENKVAMVTGGAAGIGAAVARKLADEGARIVIADLNIAAAESTARDIGDAVSAVAMDAGDPQSVKQAIDTTVERLGRIDILYNNAALTDAATMIADSTPVDIEFELFNRVLRVNLGGYLAGCKYAIPYMLEQGGGAIVNTTSATALAGQVGRTAYSCSKAAIIQLTRQVATTYGKQGVRCNAIAPFVILSEAAKKALPPEVMAIEARYAITPYLGELSDMANLACYLCSDESRFITGQVINCDGGLFAQQPYVPDMRDYTQRMTAS